MFGAPLCIPAAGSLQWAAAVDIIHHPLVHSTAQPVMTPSCFYKGSHGNVLPRADDLELYRKCFHSIIVSMYLDTWPWLMMPLRGNIELVFGWFLSETFSTSLFGQSKCEMECNITWFPLSGCCKEWCLSQSWSTQSDCLERSPARNSAKCPTNTNKMQLNIRHTTQTGLYLAADFQTWSNFVKLIV